LRIVVVQAECRESVLSYTVTVEVNLQLRPQDAILLRCDGNCMILSLNQPYASQGLMIKLCGRSKLYIVSHLLKPAVMLGEEPSMVKVTYEIVPHDEGWAYRLNGAYSERFGSHDEALEAARIVVRELSLNDEPVRIIYQDEDGKWRAEMSSGDDRPEVEIVDHYQPVQGSHSA
jgi:hypothetical protein